ncbi:hypothetical protein ASPZODRAFT_133026 [Penicilliopsis zonata CBS 506.65]|uniref:CENP-V/GFA domain-containing protein n=1 Tax=Penicilliopsis zonata CBS 506.65 TaxID=1073090 RepID=A0A1L9SFP1_9EURO|nr:hypothetical protein ASPZODRAFT_133026 [Penicilliopsis zonata CBS 506.65]OJJ46060.1 hypothetical protein ASPZODRAFT_133026 [Penicilliopsis zonata CBS 506.65]
MAVGSCFCGKVKVEYAGQPLASALCHCLDCRKLTGTLCTYSFVVKRADLKVTGSPKAVAKTADSGKSYENYFCPECGSSIYGQEVKADGTTPETIVLRAGILDDIETMTEHKPEVEVFTDRRLNWISPIEGAHQVPGMLQAKQFLESKENK